MTIDELKDELNLYTKGRGVKDYKYPDYPAFKRDVLNKSVKRNHETYGSKELKFRSFRKFRKVYKLKFSYTIGYEGDTREDSEFTKYV
ncbi:hypothetical protein ACQ7CQ_26810 [Escherichia coli]|uniref:hypothetical protein n=1 Tax=Escherichia coli TaxID=562 RepID=UPI003D356C9C